MPKDFKTINEQIELLRSRNLIIADDQLELTKDFLKKNNYYRIRGYTLTLRNHDIFYPNTTIQNVIDIYQFDREFRNLLMRALEIIEVNFKSRYAYVSGQVYGPLGYMKPEHFTDYNEYIRIIHNVNNSVRRRMNDEAFLKHYIKELHEPLPIWVFISMFTISDISRFYSISSDRLMREVAKEYGFTFNSAPAVLMNYLHGMTIVRNLCAHNSRLFNRLFITKPNLNKKELRLLNKDERGNPDNSKLFGYFLNMRRLLTVEEFTDLKSSLSELCDKYPFVEMKHYRFCPQWRDKI